MKRMIIALTVADDADVNDLADRICEIGDDPTVWEWAAFWADFKDGVVTFWADTTRSES